MHGKIKNILKKTALLLTLGLTCITAVSIGKPQKVQAASHIYKNKTFYVYTEHAVLIKSYFSDDKISQSKLPNWNNRFNADGSPLGSITVRDVGQENHIMKDGKTKNCHKYEVKMENVDVKNKTPYIGIFASTNNNEGYYPVSARITASDGNNGCDVKANEYKQLEETLDASNMLFAYIGYSFTGTEMEVGFNQCSYTVNYSAGTDGIGSVPSQTANYNTATKIASSAGLSRKGYSFNGWLCSDDNKTYNSGDSFTGKWIFDPTKPSTIHKDYNMTAQWKAKTYTVTYDKNQPAAATKNGNNVSGEMTGTDTFTYDTPKALSANKFKLKGWTFACWNTKANGSGESYTNAQTICNANNGNNMKLYAQWVPNIYKIKLNNNGGIGDVSAIYEKYDNGFYYDDTCSKVISGNKISVPVKTNYTFNGYYNGDNTVQVIDGNGNIKVKNNNYGGDSAVIAHWTPNTFKITCNDNNGSGGGAVFYEWFTKGFYSDDAHGTEIATVKVPTREHFTFKGYFTKKCSAIDSGAYKTADKGQQIVDENGNIKAQNTQITKNTTIYAVWVPDQFIITLDSNGATNKGTRSYTEVYGKYNITEKPTTEKDSEATEKVSTAYTGKWQYFTAPYDGKYTFTAGGEKKELNLKAGETVKIYNHPDK